MNTEEAKAAVAAAAKSYAANLRIGDTDGGASAIALDDALYAFQKTTENLQEDNAGYLLRLTLLPLDEHPSGDAALEDVANDVDAALAILGA